VTTIYKGETTISSSATWKFIIPSLIGALLFLVPVKYDGQVTIGVGILASYLQTAFGEWLPAFILLLLGFSAVATIAATALKPAFVQNSPFLRSIFIRKK